MTDPSPVLSTAQPTAPTAPAALADARRVLILGAHGRLGAAAARAFRDAGWQVLAQVRRAPEALPAGVLPLVQPLSAAAAETDALLQAVHAATATAAAGGVHAVVYAVNPVYTDWDALLLPLARQGMDIATRLGATFLLPGNVYAYGEHMPARLDEATPEAPTTRKGRQRAELEAELAARAERPGADRLRSVVIRAGDFFGGGRGSWFDLAIARDLARGKLVYPGPLDVPHAWAYLPDLARAFVAAAERAAVPGNMPSHVPPHLPPHARLHFAGHTATGAQFLAALEAAADVLGRTPARGWRRGTLPWGVIRVVGLVVPMWRELARMAYLWRVPHALDGGRLAHTLGPLPTTPLVDALRAALVDLDVPLPAAARVTPAQPAPAATT
jgi:nucleoside-diphosphate-sugar epimerase